MITLFTAAEGKVGKSTLCRLYAEYFAKTQKSKTLVIELNFYTRGTKYPIQLDDRNYDYLTIEDFLLNSNQDEDNFDSYVKATTSSENLFVIPTKVTNVENKNTTKNNIRRLLDMEEMTRYITSSLGQVFDYAYEKEYEFIFVDMTSDTAMNLNPLITERACKNYNAHIIVISTCTTDLLIDTYSLLAENMAMMKSNSHACHQTLIVNKVPDDKMIDKICKNSADHCELKGLKAAAVDNRDVIKYVLELPESDISYDHVNAWKLLKKQKNNLEKVKQDFFYYEPFLRNLEFISPPDTLISEIKDIDKKVAFSAGTLKPDLALT